MRNRIAVVAGLLLALGAFAPNAFAGTAHTQTYVHVFVDCVTQNSGTYDATFGYKNDNSTAQTVAVGSDNYFTPPPIDRGQTTELPAGHRAQRVHGQGDPERDEAHLDRVAERSHRVGERELVVVARVCTTPAPAIHVSVDCVTKNADNTYDATFAYSERRLDRADRAGRERQLLLAAADRPRPDDRVPARHAPRRIHGEGDPERDEAHLDGRFRAARRPAPRASSCAPVDDDEGDPRRRRLRDEGRHDLRRDLRLRERQRDGRDRSGRKRQLLLAAADRPRPDDRCSSPGSHHAAFTVTGIPNATKLTWTVAFGGSTRTTTASSSRPLVHARDDRRDPRRRRLRDAERDDLRRDVRVRERQRDGQTIAGGERQLLLAAADRPRPDDGVPARLAPRRVHRDRDPARPKLAWTVAFGGSTRTATARLERPPCTPTVKRIEVFVTCVTRNQGNYDATFGYENDNATAQTVAGRERQLLLAAAERPRPDQHASSPARCTTAFTVKGIPSGTRLTWTLNSGGRSDTATASQSTATAVRRSDAAAQGHDLPPDELEAAVGADHGEREDRGAGYLRHGDVMAELDRLPGPAKKHHHHKHGSVPPNNQVRQDKRH